jgi:hypothetical protein
MVCEAGALRSTNLADEPHEPGQPLAMEPTGFIAGGYRA